MWSAARAFCVLRSVPVQLHGGPCDVRSSYRAVVGGMPRLSGNTRYETAGLCLTRAIGSDGAVVLASGANYPDALAASVALAGI